MIWEKNSGLKMGKGKRNKHDIEVSFKRGGYYVCYL